MAKKKGAGNGSLSDEHKQSADGRRSKDDQRLAECYPKEQSQDAHKPMQQAYTEEKGVGQGCRHDTRTTQQREGDASNTHARSETTTPRKNDRCNRAGLYPLTTKLLRVCGNTVHVHPLLSRPSRKWLCTSLFVFASSCQSNLN